MKKIFASILALAAFVGCSKDTESNVVRTLQEVYKQSGNKAVVSYAPTADGDKDGCESHNDF